MGTKPTTDPPAAGRSDADLLAAAATGDRPAVDALVRRYVDFVYATANRLTRDRHAAEDITQGVFLVLARKAGQVRPPALSAWLHRTTCHAAANARRVAARRRRHERAAARLEVAPEGPMSNDGRDRTGPLLDDLDRAIAALGEGDRRAVVERYLLGRTAAEVGRALGTSPRAAQKRLERAVGRLRTVLSRHGGPATAGVAVTPVALAAILAAAGPSPATAAPPTLAATAATPAAKAVADGLLAASAAARAKAAAAVAAVLVMAAAVAGVGWVRRPPVAPPAVADPIAAAIPPAEAAAGDPVGTLRSGLTVELLGVCGHVPPNAGRRSWWRPDGSPLDADPYANGAPDFPQAVDGGPGTLVRSFGFACESVPAGSAATVTAAGAFGETREIVVDRFGRSVPDTVDALLSVPDAAAVTVRFNLAAGAWRTVLRTTALGGSAAIVGGRLDLGPARDGGPVVTDTGSRFDASATVDLTTSDAGAIDGEARLVAVDATGGEHVGSSVGVAVDRTAAGPTVRRETFRFAGLRAGDVAALALRSRPFDQWIEFRNVSVRPDRRAAVTVVTSDAAKGR